MGFQKVIPTLLALHGAYYALTGLWALVSLESFNQIVRYVHTGDAFEMHSIAAMAVALGLVFMLASKNIKQNRLVVLTASLVAVSVVLVELVYLPGRGWNLFWLDFVEEAFVASVFGYYFISLNEFA